MDTSVLTPSQWGLIFTLLSLDRALPFYAEMGLRLPEDRGFQQLLRRLIMENRKAYEADPSVIPPLADRVLGETRAAYGDEAARRLYGWATQTFFFVPADLPHWSAWRMILMYPEELRAASVLPAEECDLIERYCSSLEPEELRERIRAAQEQKLSEWDLEMYSIHRLTDSDDPDDSPQQINILRLALDIAAMNRFQRGWDELFARFSEDEKLRLTRYGQRMIEDEGIWLPGAEQDEDGEIVKPGELLHPDHMRSRA